MIPAALTWEDFYESIERNKIEIIVCQLRMIINVF